MKENTDEKNCEKIIVHINPGLKELIPEYIENRYEDIKSITNALKNSDYTIIQILGHGMRGSGAGYGFNTISDIGRALEQAAKNKNSEEIKKRLSELKIFLERVEIVYG
jgi:HPt (histidine-containing phosphotransfer) domain-containing protein